MIVIGESIHIISKEVKAAVENRDKAFIQNMAKQQITNQAVYTTHCLRSLFSLL